MPRSHAEVPLDLGFYNPVTWGLSRLKTKVLVPREGYTLPYWASLFAPAKGEKAAKEKRPRVRVPTHELLMVNEKRLHDLPTAIQLGIFYKLSRTLKNKQQEQLRKRKIKLVTDYIRHTHPNIGEQDFKDIIAFRERVMHDDKLSGANRALRICNFLREIASQVESGAMGEQNSVYLRERGTRKQKGKLIKKAAAKSLSQQKDEAREKVKVKPGATEQSVEGLEGKPTYYGLCNEILVTNVKITNLEAYRKSLVKELVKLSLS